MLSLLDKFEDSRPFTRDEAWLLFRLAAFAEAFGWTLLITGIALKKYAMHGNQAPVIIAGQFHGTLFIIYLAVSVVLYPSLRWRRWQAVLAVAASVPPYGSLVFEQWASRRQRKQQLRIHVRINMYNLAHSWAGI